MSLRQRRASEGGFPRLSEEDGSGTRARRRSYTGASSGPNLATPRAAGARISSPRTPRASVSGLRPIADDYELADDKLPAAQQASAELLRCRFQAVLARQILLQDLVRHTAAPSLQVSRRRGGAESCAALLAPPALRCHPAVAASCGAALTTVATAVGPPTRPAPHATALTRYCRCRASTLRASHQAAH